MSKVKVVITRRDNNNALLKRLMITPRRANVEMAGLRSADSMSLVTSAEHDIQQGDEIYYIQDVIDTKNLRGIWNFYGSFRDESGYEQDDVNATPYVFKNSIDDMTSESGSPSVSKWVGHYKFGINALSTTKVGIEIEKKYEASNSANPPIIDFSGNFDIFLWFVTSSNSNDNMTVIDNYDYINSKGFRVEVNPLNKTIKIISNIGTGADNVITYTNTTSFHNIPILLRITRQNGVFRLQIDNDEKTITSSSYSGSLNTTTNMHFFKSYHQTTGYINDTGFFGKALQFRFYNTVLEESEAKLVYISKAQSMTMKFGGKVWKVKDKGTGKSISCISYAKELLDTEITPSTFGTATEQLFKSNGRTAGWREGNIFYEMVDPIWGGVQRPSANVIIQNIIQNILDETFVYYPDEPSNGVQGDFISTGSLLDILKTLFVIDQDVHQFAVLPRKVLLINETSHLNTVVNDNTYNLLSSGKDDTGTTNSLFVTGQLKHITEVTSITSTASVVNSWTSSSSIMTPTAYAANVERIVTVTRDGVDIKAPENNQSFTAGTNYYKFDTSINKISFYSIDTNSHVYVITYIYNDSAHPSFKMIKYVKDDPSIDDNGIYHRNITVPQLNSGYDVNTFANNFLADNKLINIRVTAMRQSLSNSLVVGQKVYVYYLTKSIGSISNGVITPLSMIIKSIEYSYPEGMTKINLGEYAFSGYDVEKQTVESLSKIDNVTSISKS